MPLSDSRAILEAPSKRFIGASSAVSETTEKKEKKISKNDIVYVQSRTWPSVDKPGGVARVLKVHEGGNSIKYDVIYVLGGREKQVDEAFVTLKDDNNLSTIDEDPMLPAGKRGSSNKRRKKTKGCRRSVQIYNDDDKQLKDDIAKRNAEAEALELSIREEEERRDMLALAGASYPSTARRGTDRGGYMFGGEPRGMPFPRDMPSPMPLGGYSGFGGGGGYDHYGGSGFGGGFPHPMNGEYHPYGYYR